jgi:hypothetical protein
MNDWLKYPDSLGLFEVVVGVLFVIGLPVALILIFG